ncbi:MAG: DUF5693 family protein [Candidatus Velthaea sp.]
MTYRRILLILLAVGLAAAAYVAVRRIHHEAQARYVEIVLDDADFASLARSYGYDQRSFLRALKGAGLTSLAVAEELGSGVSSSGSGAVYAGTTLLAQARLGSLSDPVLAGLARTGGLRPDEVYLIAYDAPTAQRYRTQLGLKFAPKTVRVLRAALPVIFAIRTQSDYFAAVGLGLSADRVALAKSLGLDLAPRLQNDERFDGPQIDALVKSAAQGARARTLIFFGLRNAVLGYPSSLDATAQMFLRTKLNFGDIETYDPKQVQAGSDDLARKIPGRIVRVQAISKLEQDKLLPRDIIERYLLGVRERNIRVLYLRPFAHQWDLGKGPLSIEATNVELVRRIADGVRRDGYRLGGASPIYPFVVQPWLVGLVSLAVPAMALLLLDTLGMGGRIPALSLIGCDLVLVIAGYALHHDMLARQALALAAGIVFPVAGFATIAPAFSLRPARSWAALIGPGLRVMVLATAVTLGGALIVIGLLSTPLTMVEVDRFAGVKLLLLAPPLAALALYLLNGLWGARVDDPIAAANAPVRLYQLALGILIVGGAYVLQARSGNQSDITPSSFELALRSHLTSILSVRPRFKEFLIGFPALMLVPALTPADRRTFGWLFVLAIGMGLGDVVDTFSHLHTPLLISVLRIVNGVVLGAIVGILAIGLYRRAR